MPMGAVRVLGLLLIPPRSDIQAAPCFARTEQQPLQALPDHRAVYAL